MRAEISRPLPFAIYPPSSDGLEDDDDDDDMMIDSPPRGHFSPMPFTNTRHLAPPNVVHEAVSISEGRVDTPIYGHFVAPPPKVSYRPATIDAMVEESPATTPASAFPPAMLEGDQSIWWQRRRLPSPDSEDGDDLVSPREPNGGMMGMLKVTTSTDNLQYDGLSLNSPATPSGLRHAMSIDEPPPTSNASSHMARPVAHGSLPTIAEPTGPPGTTSTARNPPSRKMGFSMGYRADCEKCRLKVPGHYSHIIRD